MNFLLSAMEAVSIPEPASAGLLAWWFIDLFGLLILPFAAGVYLLARRGNIDTRTPVYWFLSFYLFYLIIVNQGVDKPPGILWLTERFLFPMLPFFVLIASKALSALSPRNLFIFAAIAVILFTPLYQRYAQPAIELEGGIRGATVETAAFIRSNVEANATIFCNHNCPSLAYYIPQKVEWYRSDQSLPGGAYLVYFGDLSGIDREKFDTVKSVRSGEQEVSLLVAK